MLTIVNSIVINTDMQVHLWYADFSGHIESSSISVSYGGVILLFYFFEKPIYTFPQ